MATTVELQARLAAIEEAIHSGVMSTSYSTPDGGTQSVTFASYADKLRARDDIRRQLGIGKTRPKAGRIVWGG